MAGGGGNTQFGNSSYSKVLTYLVDGDSSMIHNTSPVPLMVFFRLQVPQAYKSGFGRPDVKVTSVRSDLQVYFDANATVDGGEPGKGLYLTIRGSMEPGAKFRVTMQSVDFSKPMKNNLIDIFASDDFGGDSPVLTGPIPKEDYDASLETPVSFVPQGAGAHASFISWSGPYTGTDPMGFGANASRLPSFISTTRYRLGGTMDSVALRNDSDTEYIINFSLVINDWQGSIRYYCPNGERTEMEMNGRTIGVATVAFPPGGIMAYGYDAYNDSPFLPVTVTMSIVPGKYSNVFSPGLTVL